MNYSEFEIQARLYIKLVEIYGPQQVRGEWNIYDGLSLSPKARLDIVVFKPDLKTFDFAIEVKSRVNKSKGTRTQLKRYAKLLSCPVYLIDRLEDIDKFIKWSKSRQELMIPV